MLNRNQPQQNTALLGQYAQTVEQILGSVGIDPQNARLQVDAGSSYAWHFQRGSAVIEVYISIADDESAYLQLVSPIVHIPQQGLLPFYRHLLELNMTMTNAALGVYNDVVYVFNERPLQDLDASELNFVIMQLSAYADDLDNQLADEFGARMYQQP